jgi:predicted ATPase/DNA-binding XRE family transcriptional regulator
MDDASFGEWLRRRRRALDLTQEALAARVGCSVATIRKIETDDRRPSRQIAEILAEVLAIAPDERPLFLQVARGERRTERLASAPLPTDRPGVRPTPAPPSRLPIPLTPLIGRETELAELTQLLGRAECRLLTLIGPGGIGKTRLAIAAAAEQSTAFRDGVCFVALAPLSAPDFIVPAIAAALGLAFYGPMEPKTQLLNYVREKVLLLVLDNIEHLVDGVGLLAEMLQHAANVKLVVTSRERLLLQGEWVVDLQGLAVPPDRQTDQMEAYSAVGLFVERARRVRTSFILSERNRADVARICQLVDGLPLGIELAAAWMPTLSCAEIAQEIAHNLDFLATSVRDLPARHRSLRAVFDHSWKLLVSEERQVLRRLALFRGGFTREAAEQVAGATLALLSALVTKSMLRRAETGRYDMHELIRQYTAAQLQADPQEEARARTRFSDYYASRLAYWERQLKSRKQHETSEEMAVEIDNLRQAWDWLVADQQIAHMLQSLHTLWQFYDLRGWLQEGAALFGKAVSSLQTSNSGGAATALGQLMARQGWFCFRLGQPKQARALLEHSLDLLQSSADGAARAVPLIYLGIQDYQLGNYPQALQSTFESLALFRALNDHWGIALCLNILSQIYLDEGKIQEAYGVSSESLAIWRAVGDSRGTAACLRELGESAYRLGRHEESQRLLKESLAINRALNYRWGIAATLYILGGSALILGETARAERLVGESVALFREVGDRLNTALVLNGMGAVRHSQGMYHEAKAYFQQAFDLATEMQALSVALEALVGVAGVRVQEGSIEPVLELLIHVVNHPASNQRTKDRAEELRAGLEAQLNPQQIQAAHARAQAQTFEAVVQVILAMQ